MEQVLELVFKTAEGDTKVITVTDPRTDITAEEAQEAMTRIINHPALRNLPFYLETPNELPGYANEIALLRARAL